jgi:hypothetical protein
MVSLSFKLFQNYSRLVIWKNLFEVYFKGPIPLMIKRSVEFMMSFESTEIQKISLTRYSFGKLGEFLCE